MQRSEHIILAIFLLFSGCGMIAISYAQMLAHSISEILLYVGIGLYFTGCLYASMLAIFSLEKKIITGSYDTTMQYTGNTPSMKQNTIRLVLPLALTLVIWVTMVRHINIVDGPRTLEFTGFPFAYTGGLCGSSMCKNFYILELLGDCLVHIAVLYVLALACYEWIAEFKVPKYIAIILWAPAVLWVAFWAFFTISTTDTNFYWYCDYTIQEVVKVEWDVFGYRF